MDPAGDPDEVGDSSSPAGSSTGRRVDGFTVNSPADGHVEGRVELLGEVLRKVLGIRQDSRSIPSGLSIR
jgi:hypothetical protein